MDDDNLYMCSSYDELMYQQLLAMSWHMYIIHYNRIEVTITHELVWSVSPNFIKQVWSGPLGSYLANSLYSDILTYQLEKLHVKIVHKCKNCNRAPNKEHLANKLVYTQLIPAFSQPAVENLTRCVRINIGMYMRTVLSKDTRHTATGDQAYIGR